MPGDVEWLPAAGDDDARPDAAEDIVRTDEVDVGRDGRLAVGWQRLGDRWARVPVAARAGAGVALVAAASIAVALALGGSAPGGRPVAEAAQAGPGTAPDRTTVTVAALARDTHPLTDYVRSAGAPGTCSVVPVGTMPRSRLVGLVRGALPDYAIRDVGSTLDQFTALCMMQLRARDAHGTTLVVQVSAARVPGRNPFPQLTIASQTDGASTVAVATDVTEDGWTVIVGSVGPADDQPSSATLMRLAQDPALRW